MRSLNTGGLWAVQTCYKECEETICQLSVIPDEKAERNHEVWSHREEGQGSHCLDYPCAIQWSPCAQRTNPYLTIVAKCVCRSNKKPSRENLELVSTFTLLIYARESGETSTRSQYGVGPALFPSHLQISVLVKSLRNTCEKVVLQQQIKIVKHNRL